MRGCLGRFDDGIGELGENLVAHASRRVGLPKAVLAEPYEHGGVPVERRMDLRTAELVVDCRFSFYYSLFRFLIIGRRIEGRGADAHLGGEVINLRPVADLLFNPFCAFVGED